MTKFGILVEVVIDERFPIWFVSDDDGYEKKFLKDLGEGTGCCFHFSVGVLLR